MANATDTLLAERQSTHGEYAEHARVTQHTLRMWETERNWPTLSNMQKETLHMIAHKVGRILTGNPDVADHWDDIAGYSRLISQRLESQPELFNGNELYAVIARGKDISREDAQKQYHPRALIDAFVKHDPSILTELMARHGYSAPPSAVPTQPTMPSTAPLDTPKDGPFLTDEEVEHALAQAQSNVVEEEDSPSGVVDRIFKSKKQN